MIRLKQPHPGEILKKEFLDPWDMSLRLFAAKSGISRSHLGRIVNGQVSVTPQMSVRLGKALGTYPAFWTNMQDFYDRRKARK